MRSTDEPSYVPMDALAPPPSNDNTGVMPPAATTWVGVRKPTPAELRAYAASNGWSEDFARNDDATLSQWIADRWDVGRNKFRSYHAPQDAGDWAYVEKPSESVVDPSTGTEWGPWGNQDAVNVTEQKARAAAAPAPATSAIPAASSAPTTPTNPLQQQLIDMFTKGGGYFAEHPGALSLAGGGIVWKDPTETGGQPGVPSPMAPTAMATPTAPAPTPAAAPAATTPTTPGVNPSLAKATLNAFTSAGDAGVSGGVVSAPKNPTWPAIQPAATPAAPAAPTLQEQLSRMYANPNQWWRAQNPRMTR